VRGRSARKRAARLLVIGLALHAAAAFGLSNRPNVLMVFIDDLGYTDLGCFGGTGASTPNIDRLAAEGLRFRSFYVNAPICSPSRTALATGQYPQRWRITSYLDNRQANERRGMASWLDPRAPLLARELQRSGYATGHFGKWHLGGQRDVGDAPLITDYGFDRSLTNFEGLGPRVLPLCDAYDGTPVRRHDLGSAGLGRGPIRWADRSGITAAFVQEALTFMEEAATAGKPFYVNLWPDDVHSPFFPPKALRAGAGKDKRALYQAVLTAMDQQLGPLFDRVRSDDRLRQNTLILLASDNGPEAGAGSSLPLRGSKGLLYEGGVRAPLIVWGPGLLAPGKAGSVNGSAVLCTLDLNRSLYAVTGTPLPQEVTLDGENLAEVLLGKTQGARQAPVYWRRPPDRPEAAGEKNPDLAVREGTWKAYTSYDGETTQLYDLRVDVSEKTDLAARQPEVAARLTKAMLAWNAGLPADSGSRKAKKRTEP
jgi:uncharacterized sulfatase